MLNSIAMQELKVPEDYDLESSACHLDRPCYTVKAAVGEDLGRLMPFLNSRAQVIQYEPGEEPVMIFKLEKLRVALRRNEIAAGPVADRQLGDEALSMVIAFMNEIWRERDGITPNFKPRRRPPALEIYKLLPGTNCKECGEPACMAFAVKLALGRLQPEACGFLKKDTASMQRLNDLLDL